MVHNDALGDVATTITRSSKQFPKKFNPKIKLQYIILRNLINSPFFHLVPISLNNNIFNMKLIPI